MEAACAFGSCNTTSVRQPPWSHTATYLSIYLCTYMSPATVDAATSIPPPRLSLLRASAAGRHHHVSPGLSAPACVPLGGKTSRTRCCRDRGPGRRASPAGLSRLSAIQVPVKQRNIAVAAAFITSNIGSTCAGVRFGVDGRATAGVR